MSQERRIMESDDLLSSWSRSCIRLCDFLVSRHCNSPGSQEIVF